MASLKHQDTGSTPSLAQWVKDPVLGIPIVAQRKQIHFLGFFVCLFVFVFFFCHFLGEKNPTSILAEVGSILDLAQWVRDLALP